jgi:hypothetical protein
MEFVDIVLRPLLVCFSTFLWSELRAIQTQDACPNGARNWVFFGVINSVASSTTASMVAFTLVIVMGSFQLISVVAAAGRLWTWNNQKALPQDIARGCQLPAVIWWVAKLQGRDRIVLPQRVRWIAFLVARLFQLAIVAYVISTIERTVAVNGIQKSDNQWGFGQITLMVNLLAMAILVSYRLIRSVLLLRFHSKVHLSDGVDLRVEDDALVLPVFMFVFVPLWLLSIIVTVREFGTVLLGKPESFLEWVGLIFVPFLLFLWSVVNVPIPWIIAGVFVCGIFEIAPYNEFDCSC